MKYKLVSTSNTMAIMDAADAVAARLRDPHRQVMGLGLIYGPPGLGKTETLEAFAARAGGHGLNVAFVRALRIWTDTSMLSDLVSACALAPDGYRKDLLFNQLKRKLLSGGPFLFIVDEIDVIARRPVQIGILKDIHDVMGSAVLMVGEEGVEAALQRYSSFANRFNKAGVLMVRNHSADDVALVIAERCDVAVDDDVCDAIHAKTGGKSMRSVIVEIEDMETFARANGLDRIAMSHYRAIELERKRGTSNLSVPRPAAVSIQAVRSEAVNA